VLVHKIVVAIEVEVLLNKIAFLHAEVFGNAFNIGLFEPWRMIFATIGALQTIDVGKGFVVEIG
jgi:hypothetical protein